MKGLPRIEEFFVFVVTDSDGTEGIAAFAHEGVWMPMVCADRKTVVNATPIAEQIARASGQPVRLVRFSERTDLEEIR